MFALFVFHCLESFSLHFLSVDDTVVLLLCFLVDCAAFSIYDDIKALDTVRDSLAEGREEGGTFFWRRPQY